MSDTRAPAAPEMREFDAEVTAVDERTIELHETYFYAEAGGQPADRGTLAGERVEHVESRDGRVLHHLAEEPKVGVGETVHGVIDDEFRTYCMRAHTASHALYGAGRHLLDDIGYAGFGIDEQKVRVDFTTTTEIDDETLVELERLVNRAVWDSRPVSWEEVPVEEARAREEVSFNTKTEEGVMSDADQVRIVTIEGWDWAACGGTHVSNTSEIGPVSVLERSNPGEGMTRVEFAVGPTGIDYNRTVHESALETATVLDSPVDSLPEAARDLRARVEQLETEVEELTGELLGTRLRELPTMDRDGATWRVGTMAGVDPNAVGDRAQELVGDAADVFVVVEEGPAPFVVVASDGSVDAGDLVADVTDEFGGGGGGGPTFAQGGGLGADGETVVDSLRGE